MFNKGHQLNRTLFESGMLAISPYAQEYPDSYGVEVELEGENIIKKSNAILAYWKTHQDNSLRVLKNENSQAIEYVNRHPFPLPELMKGVDVLFDYLNSPGV